MLSIFSCIFIESACILSTSILPTISAIKSLKSISLKSNFWNSSGVNPLQSGLFGEPQPLLICGRPCSLNILANFELKQQCVFLCWIQPMNLIFLEQYSPTSTHLFCLLSFASFFSSSLQGTSPINTLSLSQQPPPVKPKICL